MSSLLLRELVRERVIDEAQADEIQSKARLNFMPILKVLVEDSAVDEKRLVETLSRCYQIPVIDLQSIEVKPEAITKLPENFAKERQVLPYNLVDDRLFVAILDPQDVTLADDIHKLTGLRIYPTLAYPSELRDLLSEFYGGQKSFLDAMQKINFETDQELLDALNAQLIATEHDTADDAPIVKAVNLILSQAIHEGASDVHIEPAMEFVRIRFRVDGMLKEMNRMEKGLQVMLVSRIKIMGKMDISETRVAQDGRASLRFGKQDIDIRISTFPTIYGENMVLRLLNSKNIQYRMEHLGLAESDNLMLNKLIHVPYGILLVTGPTGSGKTTSLYAMLQKLNSIEKNIMTVEDPVEYNLPGILQGQINPKVGFTFAGGLRAILRQDPDIIMIGEIRDRETAEIAIQAAMTGHLVLSTLHTNDAPSAITRLVEMGIEPFLVASSLLGVIAQRLTRKICEACKHSYTISGEVYEQVNKGYEQAVSQLHKGEGCLKCGQSGYRGRVGIFEVLANNEEIREFTLHKDSAMHLQQAAMRNGMRTMYRDGIDKARQGITTLEEVVRVSQ